MSKFHDLRSILLGNLIEFKKVCEIDSRQIEDEIEEVVEEALDN